MPNDDLWRDDPAGIITEILVELAGMRATIKAQAKLIARLREGLENIAAEAERTNGSWVHLKRVVGVNARALLAELDAKP